MRIGCVLMASGEGRRFAAAAGPGAPMKLLAPLAGAPLVVRTARSVPPAFELVAATRWPDVAAALAPLGVRIAVPDGPRRSDSLRAGLAAGAGAWDGCLFLPGDQPLVSAESFAALAAALEGDPGRAHRLAWRGRPGSPVLFPRSSFPALARLRGGEGGAGLLRSGAVGAGLVEVRRAEELLDVDVPDDLRAAERALRGGGTCDWRGEMP